MESPLTKANNGIAALMAAIQLWGNKPLVEPKIGDSFTQPQVTLKPKQLSIYHTTSGVALPFKQSPANLKVGLHPELIPLMTAESSGGKPVNHPQVFGDDRWKTAHGHLGLMPYSAYERYSKDKPTQKLYPKLQDKDAFYQAFTANPKFYNHLANLQWNYLGKRLGGDISRMAYGWLAGEGNAAKASPEYIKNHDYVQKYHAATAKLAEPAPLKEIKKCAPDEFAAKFKAWMYKNRKKLKKSSVYSNLFGKITDSDRKMARKMIGREILDTPEFKAARFLANSKNIGDEEVNSALAIYESDHVLAALYAYGLPTTDAFKAKLNGIIQLQHHVIQKSATHEFNVKPLAPDAHETASFLQESFNNGEFESVHLKGKYNEGSMIVVNARTHNKWLLKPDQPHNSPAVGVSEEHIPQSRREVIFSKVAELLGLSNYVAHSDLVDINGRSYAAIEFFNSDYSGLHARLKQKEDIRKIMEPYRASGVLFRWALIDYILGNTDRHGMNIMSDSYGNVKLIDHGSALAGVSFDPAHDPNSFIPYYLRAFSIDNNFRELDPHTRYTKFPKGNPVINQQFSEYVGAISAESIYQTLKTYNANPEPVMGRLKELKSYPSESMLDNLLQIWAGIIEP